MKAIFQSVLNAIPDYKVFLTPDELDESSRKLAAEHPDLASVFEMGRTRDGRPLLCLKIGNGSKNALMFGCPHPNEPIGTMMLEHFTKSLAENEAFRKELDYTWYIVKAWDADGLALNEGWLKGPYTLHQYSRHFFRPAGHKQVDWTFPIDYKDLHFHDTIPEAEAMMKLIDEIRPKFIYSLHNAGFGGVYWYISEDTPELYDEMRAIADQAKVPLNLGEPEAPFCQQLSPAVYAEFSIRAEYDYLEQYGVTDIGEKIRVGTNSADYAWERHKSFTLLTELPYFYDERIMDLSPGTMPRKDAALAKLDANSLSTKWIKETMALTLDRWDAQNPFRLALEAFTKEDFAQAERKMVEENPEFLKTATVAEEFDNLLISRFYKALSYGMLIRANEYELEKLERQGITSGEAVDALRNAADIAEKAHKEFTDYLEANIHYQVVPIRSLVYIQLGCGLLMADHLQQKA